MEASDDPPTDHQSEPILVARPPRPGPLMVDGSATGPRRPAPDLPSEEAGDPDRWPPMSYWAKAAAVVLLVTVFFALVWLLRSVALVLVASLVLAIGLQPSIRWLEQRGLGRGLAMAAILSAGLVLFVAFGLVMIPFLIDQISALVEELPGFLDRLRQSPGMLGSISQSKREYEEKTRAARMRAGSRSVSVRTSGLIPLLRISVSNPINAPIHALLRRESDRSSKYISVIKLSV